MRLVGYTNNATGIPTFDYVTSNVPSAGFAMFRADNSTRSTFSCYILPLFVNRAGSAETETIPLQGTLHNATSRKLPLMGNDFKLSPRSVVVFAVPVPEIHGMWQCGLSLTHIRNYSYRWQYEIVLLAQRCGLHFGEAGQSAMSEEIVR